MHFNHHVNLLRRHCYERGEVARQKYEKAGHSGASYVSYLWTDEMTYKLETLIDTEFSSVGHFVNTVRALVSEHYAPRLQHSNNVLERNLAEREEQAFLALLNDLPEPCPEISIPYRRFLLGREAEELVARFAEKWDFVPNRYWYPLCGEWKPDADCMFVMDEVAEPYWATILDLLCPVGEHVYATGEDAYSFWLSRPCMREEDRSYISPHGGSESAYTDKNFTRMLYVSHESTVSFAGDWVPAVKHVLQAEEARWNHTFWADIP